MQPTFEAVKEQLEKILASQEFADAVRSSQFLRFVVEKTLEGTSSELKEYVIGVAALGRKDDFDPRVDSTVRTEASRLRARLKEYYAGPGSHDRILIDLPKGGYHPIFYYPDEPAAAPVLTGPPGRPRSRRTLFAVAALLATITLVAGALLWRSLSSVTGSPERPVLRRITADLGMTEGPALSPDGKLLAYMSDRSGEGNLDIWVQQLPDGQPVRLTSGPEDEWSPSFSPDGRKVVFYRQRSGVWVVPVLGGEERRLAASGWMPRFSPDGRWIAYSTSVEVNEGSRVMIIPAEGGEPREVKSDLQSAGWPVWSPDGRNLLVLGHANLAASLNHMDVYVVPASGGTARKTGLNPLLVSLGYSTRTPPADWLARGNRIIFHAHRGDLRNVWQARLDQRTFKVEGEPERVTFGTSDDEWPSVTQDGDLAYTSRATSSSVWMLPVDADRAMVHGDIQRLSRHSGNDYYPWISADGNIMVWSSRPSGRPDELYLRDLSTGKETALTATSRHKRPILSSDGSRIGWSNREDDKLPLFVLGESGSPEKVCEDCGAAMTWTPDTKAVVYRSADNAKFRAFELDSGKKVDVLAGSDWRFHSLRYSPDGRWMAFGGISETRGGQVCIAPVTNYVPAGENEWSCIERAEQPGWSPSGRILYYISEHGGRTCLFAQRLSAAKRPAGAPKPLHCFSRSVSTKNLSFGISQISVGKDKILLNFGERTGNIWLTRIPD